MTMDIRELNETNCKTYLVSSGGQAVLVDPVREGLETYRKAIADAGLELTAILETHLHADHLMFNREIKDSFGVPIVMHENSPSPLVDRHVADGDVIDVGGEEIKVLHTPGHTPDSVCYVTEGAVLTGDTLLIGGSGRCDFPGGDPGQQYDGIVGKLFALPDDTVVWPAHDYNQRKSSLIGTEKRENPRVAGKTREQYIEIMNGLNLPFPERIQMALQVNQSGFEADEVAFPAVAQVASARAISPQKASEILGGTSAAVVIDVREPEEFVGELGHIPGALLVPLDSLHKRLPKLVGYSDREVIVVCRAGARSASASAILSAAGFGNIYNLEGGMLSWHKAGLSVQR